MKHSSYQQLSVLPKEVDLLIFLIREELKNRKFFNYLRQAGLDGSIYQADLTEAIFSLAGINDPSDEVSDFYHHLMEKHSNEMKPEEEDMTRRAMMVWRELTGKVSQRAVI